MFQIINLLQFREPNVVNNLIVLPSMRLILYSMIIFDRSNIGKGLSWLENITWTFYISLVGIQDVSFYRYPVSSTLLIKRIYQTSAEAFLEIVNILYHSHYENSIHHIYLVVYSSPRARFFVTDVNNKLS